MKAYTPEKPVTISRYQNYFPTLPQEIREDVYGRMEQLLSEENEYSRAKSREMGARLRKTAKIPGFKRLFLKMWGPVRFLCEVTEIERGK